MNSIRFIKPFRGWFGVSVRGVCFCVYPRVEFSFDRMPLLYWRVSVGPLTVSYAY